MAVDPRLSGARLYESSAGTFMKSSDGSWRRVSGAGSLKELSRLLGAPTKVPDAHIGTPVGSTTGSGGLFKPGELETLGQQPVAPAPAPAPVRAPAPAPTTTQPVYRQPERSRDPQESNRTTYNPAPNRNVATSPAPVREQPQQRDFFAEARALYPWLPNDLLRVFAGHWEESGNANLALGRMRQSPLYDRHFPGNKRSDGSLRHSEQGYFATREGFRSAMAEFGLDPSRNMQGLFENEVSVNEFARGVSSAYERFRRPGGEMPRQLLDTFVNQFTNTGSAELALNAVRDTREYQQVFAGIRREDGSMRMSEQEYFATLDTYARELSGYGLNPQAFRPRFVGLIEGEVSGEEFRQRLAAADEQVVRNIADVRQFYADNYGISLSDEAIFGSFIDPQIGRGVLEGRISASQIGGEARAAGFQRSLARAEQLASAGIGQDQARQLYRRAVETVPLMQQLVARHHDPDDPFTLEDFEEAGFMGDADVQRRMQRRVQQERASFSGLRVAEDQGGGLSGLRRR